MNIKVCGITDIEQLSQLAAMNVDYAGFVFHKESPFYIDGNISANLLNEEEVSVNRVGVFVNSSLEYIRSVIAEFKLHMVQLEGNEEPALCKELSAYTQVAKTFFIDHSQDDTIDHLLEGYDDCCDYYTFDTVVKKNFGGIAEKFDLHKIAASKIEKPFFLGGGIKPTDTELIRNFHHPDFFGIDLNCYFDERPGVKDIGMLREFIQSLQIIPTVT